MRVGIYQLFRKHTEQTAEAVRLLGYVELLQGPADLGCNWDGVELSESESRPGGVSWGTYVQAGSRMEAARQYADSMDWESPDEMGVIRLRPEDDDAGPNGEYAGLEYEFKEVELRDEDLVTIDIDTERYWQISGELSRPLSFWKELPIVPKEGGCREFGGDIGVNLLESICGTGVEISTSTTFDSHARAVELGPYKLYTNLDDVYVAKNCWEAFKLDHARRVKCAEEYNRNNESGEFQFPLPSPYDLTRPEFPRPARQWTEYLLVWGVLSCSRFAYQSAPLCLFTPDGLSTTSKSIEHWISNAIDPFLETKRELPGAIFLGYGLMLEQLKVGYSGPNRGEIGLDSPNPQFSMGRRLDNEVWDHIEVHADLMVDPLIHDPVRPAEYDELVKRTFELISSMAGKEALLRATEAMSPYASADVRLMIEAEPAEESVFILIKECSFLGLSGTAVVGASAFDAHTKLEKGEGRSAEQIKESFQEEGWVNLKRDRFEKSVLGVYEYGCLQDYEVRDIEDWIDWGSQAEGSFGTVPPEEIARLTTQGFIRACIPVKEITPATEPSNQSDADDSAKAQEDPASQAFNDLLDELVNEISADDGETDSDADDGETDSDADDGETDSDADDGETDSDN